MFMGKAYRLSGFSSIFIYIYLFSMILEKVKWDIGGWSFELFLLLVPVYFVVLVFLNAKNRNGIKISGLEVKIFTYYVVLIAYLLFQFFVIKKDSTITTQYIKGVITTVIQFIATINLALLYRYYRNKITFEYVCKLLVLLATVNALYCLIQLLNPNIDSVIVELLHSTVVRYGMDSYGKLKRVTGFLLEPNFNGPFLVIGFIVGIHMLSNMQKKGKRKGKVLLLTSIVLIGIMCLMTLSLTAYIGLLAWFVLFMKGTEVKNKKKILYLLLVSCAVIVYIIVTNRNVYNVVVAKLSFMTSMESFKSNSHVRILIESFQIYFSDKRIVWFGTGVNCMNVYFQRMFDYPIMKAHSYFVQYLCEAGLFGWGIYLSYFGLLYKNAGKSAEGKLVRLLIICTIMMNFTYDPFTRNYNLLLVLMAFVSYRDSKYKGLANSIQTC